MKKFILALMPFGVFLLGASVEDMLHRAQARSLAVQPVAAPSQAIAVSFSVVPATATAQYNTHTVTVQLETSCEDQLLQKANAGIRVSMLGGQAQTFSTVDDLLHAVLTTYVNMMVRPTPTSDQIAAQQKIQAAATAIASAPAAK